ncbi:flagellar basal body rod protein FlgB [Sinimarinibacterium sp. CAU 1509]|uniref:flagellar basal body rod protein FlgB n=1 Tax=Sinimarinibacterium sp. CAU 1509 TaxID=2562283 RepID=UPI0010AC6511|nr:flagellar basal body rod protein FlgB [Sinimarinibacterium sp. CAU 1509]TJY62878.1 flagellar basal body rod protein FlgB [Sinimarinibacterium sp. CAU 1509]
MAGSDPLFGVHPAAMQLQRRRMELIASNIANADTPGFKARDLDFRKVLASTEAQASGSAVSLALTPSNGSSSLGTGLNEGASDVASVYRVPLQPSVDGNTVDTQIEQAQFADAALRYQASLNFLDGRIKSLITALTGQ